jgi:hypothetical protein
VFGLKALVALCLSLWNTRYDPARHYMRGPGPASRARRAGATALPDDARERPSNGNAAQADR